MEEQLRQLIALQETTQQQLLKQADEKRKLNEKLDLVVAQQLEQEQKLESKIAERLADLATSVGGTATATSAAAEATQEPVPGALASPDAGQPAETTTSDLLRRLVVVQEQVVHSLSQQQSQSLVDLRGLAKPSTFSNKEEEFHEWRRKLLNYVGAVPGFDKVKKLLNLSAEHKGPISILELHS